MESEILQELLNYGALGIFAIYLIARDVSNGKRLEKLEDKRQEFATQIDQRLDELARLMAEAHQKLDQGLSKMAEKYQEDRMKEIMRQSKRTRTQTAIKPRGEE
jgi:hypothetical protein